MAATSVRTASSFDESRPLPRSVRRAKSPLLMKSWFPSFCAGNLPSQIQRRTVSVVRRHTLAASRTVIRCCTPPSGSTYCSRLHYYNNIPGPFMQPIPRLRRLLSKSTSERTLWEERNDVDPMIGMKQGGHRVANICGELRLVCGLARPSPLRIAEHFNPPVYEVDHPVLRDPRRRVPDGFTRPVELEARVGDFDDQFRGQRMRPKISEVPTHHGDVRFRLGVIIHPERHLDTHSVPVGEHPPDARLGRLNGQRMIGALGSHFQNLAIKQLHPGAGWEHTADHQLIVLRSSPPLRSNAHRRPPALVSQPTPHQG